MEGRDLAGNTRSCHRTVKVADSQRPDWTKDDVDKEVTMSAPEAASAEIQGCSGRPGRKPEG